MKDAARKRRTRTTDDYPRRRRSKNPWIPVGCMLLILFVLVGLFLAEERARAEDVPMISYTSLAEAEPFPGIEAEVLLCSDSAKQLYDHEIDVYLAIKTGAPYRPLVFEYDMGGSSGKIILSEEENFSTAREYPMDQFKSVFRIDNLKTDTDYFYKVIIDDREYAGEFHTVASTRFISLPGLENIRDIGGYTNMDGKRVKQGLLIRGTEIDGLDNPNYILPESLISDVQEEFGFVYDMDLRTTEIYEGDYTSPFGENVGHAFYTAPSYEQLFEAYWKPNVRRIFADLADPGKYPMYLHCTWGKDRTGGVVYLLQAVLNMSEKDMEREYMLSGFVHQDIREQDNFHYLVDGLSEYAGNTIQEKAVNYLLDVGVTERELKSIRQIFLTE